MRASVYDRALVLLSGGFDSTAALHWAIKNHPSVRAISFDYGQPNRDDELYRAQIVAERLGVPWGRVTMADTLPRLGLLHTVQDHSKDATGTNKAFVPGRNAVFLSVAGAHAATSWPTGNLDLVIGACPEDAAGFPDCRPGFLCKMGETLRAALAREVQIVAPFIDRTKSQVLQSFNYTTAADDLALSYSCYRGGFPCRKCSACVVRGAAFAELGITDRSIGAIMGGGDPHREAR